MLFRSYLFDVESIAGSNWKNVVARRHNLFGGLLIFLGAYILYNTFLRPLLWDLYQRHMARAVEVTAEGIAFHLRYQQYNEPELMLNLISHGPIEKGLDMTCGGAMYYNLCMDGSAIATVADSFGALQQRVEIGRAHV